MALQSYDVWLTINGGNPLAGIVPQVITWQPITGPPTNPTLPVLSDQGGGRYSYSWDPDVDGPCEGFLDVGPTVMNDRERFVYLSARISPTQNFPPVFSDQFLVFALDDAS